MLPLEILDARGLFCPLPVIRTQDKIKTLTKDTLLKVICSDPGAINDIPAWCRLNGYQVIETKQIGNDYIVIIQTKSDN